MSSEILTGRSSDETPTVFPDDDWFDGTELVGDWSDDWLCDAKLDDTWSVCVSGLFTD